MSVRKLWQILAIAVTALASIALAQDEQEDISPAERRFYMKRHKIVIAHGVIMSFAWVIVAPLGAILIRALSGSNVVHIHSITQSSAYILALTGMALGIYIAVKPEYILNVYHPVIGLVVVGLATVQPVLGTIHHRIYKTKKQRTAWATAHVWLGRIIITLAIINGGLGLRLSENTRKGEIAYGVIGGVVWLIWMAIAVWAEARKVRTKGSMDERERIQEKPGSD